MVTEIRLTTVNGVLQGQNLAETISRIEESCRDCRPLSMLECVANCQTWKLKNEFRELYKRMRELDFSRRLLNVLKNRRRLQILNIISKKTLSPDKLQEELKKLGYSHSLKTIKEEYLNPLIDVKLAAETQGRYYATLLGRRLSELARDFCDIGEILPSHSECYEEKILATLLEGAATYAVIGSRIPLRNVSRVLGRLQKAGLVETSKEKDHVFFFRTRRDPDIEETSSTEKRTYDNITDEGISARNLAKKVNISLRRTYKYLRRLKGKKMVFTREKPITFALTAKGSELALILRKIGDLTIEAFGTAAKLVDADLEQKHVTKEISSVEQNNEAKAVISPTTYIASNRNRSLLNDPVHKLLQPEKVKEP